MTKEVKSDHRVEVSAFNSDLFVGRLKTAIKLLGGVAKTARIAVVAESTVRSWRDGNSEPQRPYLIPIAKEAGISIAWLVSGEGPMRIEGLVQPGIADSQRVYAPIPRLTRQVDGREEPVESEIASVSFDRKWLEDKGLSPTDLLYTRMQDDSMQPSISEGALVVVDSSTDKIKGDGLYALMHSGEIAVKRLQIEFGGGIWIRSDNSAYKEQYVKAEKCDALYIIGRVIWVGGEV